MTTPMSLQPWWWKIVILIQLWSQFFHMFVYGDVVYARLAIDPGKLYRATFICQDDLCCCNMALISFRLFRKNLGNLKDFFGQMVYRPPWRKKFPYAYELYLQALWVALLKRFFTFFRITASFPFLFVTRARHSIPFLVYRGFFKVCLHPH